MMYRVHLRRESEQVVEFDEADYPEAVQDGPIQAATELADPSCWECDGSDVDAIEVSDDGQTWRFLPLSEVLRLERESVQ